MATELLHAMFLAYEDLLADPPGTMDCALRFAGLPPEDSQPCIASIHDNTLPIRLEKSTRDDQVMVLSEKSLRELQAAAEEVYGGQGAAAFLVTHNPRTFICLSEIPATFLPSSATTIVSF